MDEHKTTGMTAFLKKEIRAWDAMIARQRVKIGQKGQRRMIVIAMIAAALIIAVCVAVFVPWNKIIPSVPDDGTPGGVGQIPEETESEKQSESESQTKGEAEQTPETDPYTYDFSIVPQGATPIIPFDLSMKKHPVNQTDRVIDMQSVMDAACDVPAASGKISVLIIHTHTGEGYNQQDALYLNATDEEFARSEDGTDGVMAVGALIAQRLNQAGIGTIHCKTVFDGESNREAYSRAADAIQAFRMAYPSLVCVIDVHRAASTDEQGNILRSLAVANGQGIAQTQIICGMSAQQTSKTNLALAMRLYERMNHAFPGSCANVICKEQTLNQDLAPFSLTLEVGSCGNTLEEALAGAQVTADALCTLFETN